jgi:nucleotide-binding universal stress UspA family protein
MQYASGLDNVVKLGSRIANADNEMNLCLLQVVDKQSAEDEQAREKLNLSRQYTLEKFIKYAVERNVPMYSKTVSGTSTADGIVDEIRGDNNVRLLLLKWTVSEDRQVEFGETLETIIRSGLTNVGVLFDRGIDRIEDILVPVGGGLHSKLAISLAENLAQADHASIDFMRVVDVDLDDGLYEDQMAYLQEVVITELGNIPGNANLHIIRGEDPATAIVAEAQARDYDLIIIGSFEGQAKPGLPFGEVVDRIVRGSNTSVLVLRQHESPAASWLKQQLRGTSRKT